MSQAIPCRRRLAGHSEHRCIIRQHLGYQRAITIAAVYVIPPDSQLAQPNKRAFVPALKHCIARHPILSTVILGSETESPEFATPSSLDLENHVEVLQVESDRDEQSIIKHTLARTSDDVFDSVDEVPPWKIVVTRLPSNGAARLLVTFAFFHSHGDGKSGLAFHETFLEGLNSTQSSEDSSFKCEPPKSLLRPPLEEAGNLSISWSYLLGPLLGAHLPTFLSRALGLQASTASQDQDVWRGGETTFPADARDFRTGFEMIMLEERQMRSILERCRASGATFTGLLHQLIVRALSEELPDAKAFAGDTVVDLRQHTNGAIGNGDMGLCVSAENEVFQRSQADHWRDWTSDKTTAPVWEYARNTSLAVRKRASTLHDQPIGLLKYLNDFRGWTIGKIGKDHESSYEISNLGVFTLPVSSPNPSKVMIEEVVFAQPANAIGDALNFNTVSTKGGPFVLTVTWQLGVLALDRDEQAFVAQIAEHLKSGFDELATAAA